MKERWFQIKGYDVVPVDNVIMDDKSCIYIKREEESPRVWSYLVNKKDLQGNTVVFKTHEEALRQVMKFILRETENLTQRLAVLVDKEFEIQKLIWECGGDVN